MTYRNDIADVLVVVRVLKNHGIEVWEGCAVATYVRYLEDGSRVEGEQLVPLSSFKTYQDLEEWLGY